MIALDRPGRAWRLVDGGARVFAEPIGGGQRRFLARVPPGGTVAGVAPAGGWRLLAVPEPGPHEETAPPADDAFARALAEAAGADPAAADPAVALAAALDARVAAEEAARTAARASRRAADQGADAAAADHLAAVVGDRPPRPPAPDDPLFAAAVLAAPGFALVAPPPTGTPAQRLEALARASRCRLRRVDLDGEWWRDGGPPLVGAVDAAPVALLPVAAGGYALVEAATGRRLPLDARHARRVAPIAWELVRPLPEGPLGLLGLLGFAGTGTGVEVARATAWTVAVTLVGTAAPAATGLLVDRAIPEADRAGVGVLGLGLLAVTLAGAAFDHAGRIALLRLDTATSAAAQRALWDRLLRLPLPALRPFPVGELLSRAEAVTTASLRLTAAALQSALGGALGLANFGLLVLYSPPLAALAAVAGAAMAGLAVAAGLVGGRRSRALVARRTDTFSATVQVVGGVAKLQAAGVRGAALAWWWRRYVAQLEQQWAVWTTEDRLAAARTALHGLTTAALFAAGARLHDRGALSVGGFVAFQATFQVFLASLAGVAGAAGELAAARAEAERAAPLLAATPEVKRGSADPGVLEGAVTLERVRFRYRPDGPYVLDGVSLAIRPGEFVALVGGSGCGKSTLLRLLLGFEAAESGQIRFDGQDLAGLDVEAVRRQLGVVLQGGRLGGGSILEVVAGASPVTTEAVWRALEAAALRAEVEAMPMGLHTLVGEGGGALSGGQRQRLLIARALVARPKILVFDEATSALDNRAQAEISARLAALAVTRIVVAHRLSTIRGADRVVVLGEGRVVQSGPYEALLAEDGPFRRLVSRQRL